MCLHVYKQFQNYFVFFEISSGVISGFLKMQIITCVLLTVITGVYAIYLALSLKKDKISKKESEK